IRCFFAACAVLCCLCPPSCVLTSRPSSFLFFFNDTATPEIYTLSLHDALPISWCASCSPIPSGGSGSSSTGLSNGPGKPGPNKRSEEHTSELQLRENLVCRLLLEKKKKKNKTNKTKTKEKRKYKTE